MIYYFSKIFFFTILDISGLWLMHATLNKSSICESISRFLYTFIAYFIFEYYVSHRYIDVNNWSATSGHIFVLFCISQVLNSKIRYILFISHCFYIFIMLVLKFTFLYQLNELNRFERHKTIGGSQVEYGWFKRWNVHRSELYYVWSM